MTLKAKLILMRHGESVWNKLNLFTGWVDVPLSPKGIQEAISAAESLKNETIDICFTSTLVRAQETLAIAMADHPSGKTLAFIHPENEILAEWEKFNSQVPIIPVYQAWQLNERMYGSLQGLNKDEMRAKYGKEQVQIWRRSYDVAPPEGESLKQCAARTLPYFQQEIKPWLEKGKTVLVSAHGNSLRSIIMELDRLSEEAVVSLEIPLGKPLFYNYESGSFQK